MEAGEVVCIKNTKGLRNIRLTQKLRLPEVMTGNGEDRLPKMDHPCLGFHQRGSEDIVTLTDEPEDLLFPVDIYIGFLCGNGIEVWKGRMDSLEEPDPSYTTVG